MPFTKAFVVLASVLLLLFSIHDRKCSAFTLRNPFVVTKPRVKRQTPRYVTSFDYSSETDPIATNDDVVDQVAQVRSFTEQAIRYRGETRGLEALEQLAVMCERRIPFDFKSSYSSSSSPRMEGSVISHVPELLPKHVTDEILARVRAMERNGWLSRNPDSVDGLPSFHLNLISDGKPMVSSSADELLSSGQQSDSFENRLNEITQLVEPYLYEQFLPRVNKLLNTTSIQIGDVFLRRYGQDLIDGQSRNGISAHYDVLSRVTAVIALDDVAAKGTNGLFTTEISNEGKTSNHAALRRFFPLQSGDAVVHTWDVLHGVDVQQGLDRSSLIVWFTSKDEKQTNEAPKIPPWLENRNNLATNDIAQFVLGSAMESASVEGTDRPTDQPNAMFQTLTNDKTGITSAASHFALYLESASRQNTFAFTRIASMCEEGLLTASQMKRATKVLDQLQRDSGLPSCVQRSSSQGPNVALAKRYWLEGSLRGDPVAQTALANELMVEAVQDGSRDSRLLAAVLFGLAAQQGNDRVFDSLTRVVEIEVASSDITSEEEFTQNPVVQVARVACSRL